MNNENTKKIAEFQKDIQKELEKYENIDDKEY